MNAAEKKVLRITIFLFAVGVLVRFVPWGLPAIDTVDIAELRKRLVALGYSKVNKIDQSLQFANRGDILDVFSVSSHCVFAIV